MCCPSNPYGNKTTTTVVYTHTGMSQSKICRLVYCGRRIRVEMSAEESDLPRERRFPSVNVIPNLIGLKNTSIDCYNDRYHYHNHLFYLTNQSSKNYKHYHFKKTAFSDTRIPGECKSVRQRSKWRIRKISVPKKKKKGENPVTG